LRIVHGKIGYVVMDEFEPFQLKAVD